MRQGETGVRQGGVTHIFDTEFYVLYKILNIQYKIDTEYIIYISIINLDIVRQVRQGVL